MKYEKKPREERYCIYCQKKFKEPRRGTFTCEEHRKVLSARTPLRFCSVCGESFYADKKNDRYCEKHREDAEVKATEIDDDMSTLPVRSSKRIEDNDDYIARAKIAADGRKEHLTYGQMVAKYGL